MSVDLRAICDHTLDVEGVRSLTQRLAPARAPELARAVRAFVAYKAVANPMVDRSEEWELKYYSTMPSDDPLTTWADEYPVRIVGPSTLTLAVGPRLLEIVLGGVLWDGFTLYPDLRQLVRAIARELLPFVGARELVWVPNVLYGALDLLLSATSMGEVKGWLLAHCGLRRSCPVRKVTTKARCRSTRILSTRLRISRDWSALRGLKIRRCTGRTAR